MRFSLLCDEFGFVELKTTVDTRQSAPSSFDFGARGELTYIGSGLAAQDRAIWTLESDLESMRQAVASVERQLSRLPTTVAAQASDIAGLGPNFRRQVGHMRRSMRN
jgi:hypothetical protein